VFSGTGSQLAPKVHVGDKRRDVGGSIHAKVLAPSLWKEKHEEGTYGKYVKIECE